MADEIINVFEAVYQDGPDGAPYEPPKARIRNEVGGTIQAQVDLAKQKIDDTAADLEGQINDIAAMIATGTQWKIPVLAASTGNVDIATGLENGDTLDGVTLTTGDRVLLKNQSNQTENGIYEVQASGAAIRAADANDGTEILGAAVFVRNGTSNAGKQYVCVASAPITIGTTALPFREISDQSALNATLAEKADQTEVDDLTGVVRTDLLPSPARKSGLSLEWLDVLLGDQEGDVYAGFDQYGSLRAQLQDAPGIPVISADYAYIFTLEDGTLVFAIDWDGNLVTGADARGLQAFAYIVGGVSRVAAARTSGESSDITFGENNAYGPSVSGGFIHYVESEGGSFNVKREEGLALTSLLPSVGSVQCVFVYGQSLSVGRSSSPAVSTAPVLPGRAVMFNGGSFVRGAVDDTGALTDDRIRSWADMYETRTGENPGNQLGLYLANERPADEGVLVAALGVGGQPYASLKKGTQPYANLLMAVRRARIIAGLNGLELLPPVMTWDQGQSDVAASLAQYLGYLVELQGDVTSDWSRYSGSPGEVMVFVDQMSNWTKYSVTTCEVPLAQLQSALDLPAKFACIGPQYMLDYIDGIHLTGPASARMGAYQGRAIAQHLSGVPWEPLHIASAIRTGANIVLTYAGGDEATDIAIDTTLVSNPGNFGFEWKQTGGTARTIASVTKTGTRQITVALSGDPGAPSASSIGYAVTGVSGANAGPTTGARGNIRDQSPDLTPLGAPMHNWACHQIINL